MLCEKQRAVKFFSCEIRCAGLRGMSGSTVERTARIVRTKTEAAAEAARTRGSRLVRTVTEDSIALEASRQAEAEVLQLHASTEVATPAAAAADHRFRARCSLSLSRQQPATPPPRLRHRFRHSPPPTPLATVTATPSLPPPSGVGQGGLPVYGARHLRRGDALRRYASRAARDGAQLEPGAASLQLISHA